MVNKYFIGSHISERKFRQFVWLFCLDIEAKKVSELTGISRQSINKIYAELSVHGRPTTSIMPILIEG